VNVTRLVNIAIGALTLVVSFLASVERYRQDRAFGPALLLTAAIFGFVAVTFIVTVRR
jgi:hypothetical protein